MVNETQIATTTATEANDGGNQGEVATTTATEANDGGNQGETATTTATEALGGVQSQGVVNRGGRGGRGKGRGARRQLATQ